MDMDLGLAEGKPDASTSTSSQAMHFPSQHVQIDMCRVLLSTSHIQGFFAIVVLCYYFCVTGTQLLRVLIHKNTQNYQN